MRDQESIDACNEHGIAMVFTGVRHFKHQSDKKIDYQISENCCNFAKNLYN